MVSWCPFPLVGAEVTGGCFRNLSYHLFSRCLRSGVVGAGPNFLYNISGMCGQEITSGLAGDLSVLGLFGLLSLGLQAASFSPL